MRSVVGGVCAVALVAAVSAAMPTAVSAAVPTAVSPAAGVTAQAAGTYVSLSPVRLLDTRAGGTPAAYATVSLRVLGRAGVPATGVSAVVLNVTAVGPTAAGYVTVHADGAPRPATSNLSYPKGGTVANLVVAPVGTDGEVALYNGSAGRTPLLVDVSGYYTGGTPTVAGAFRSLTPTRLLDTRRRLGGATPGARSPVDLQVTGRGGVPTTGVSAVLLTVTAVGPAAAGYVTVYGSGSARPTSSNLNFVAGRTTANLVVAPIGSGGKVTLYNAAAGATPLLADVAGYVRSGTPTAVGAFKVLPPRRVLDTRIQLGGTRPGPRGDVYLDTDGSDSRVATGVPTSNVEAVVLNVTATNTTAAGFVDVYNLDTVRPAVSNLNFLTGQTVPNLVFSSVSRNGYVDLYNGSNGANNLLADVAGYFIGDDGSLAGTVTASGTGRSLAGVEVDAFGTDGSSTGGHAVTDARGAYAIGSLPAGDYTVCFSGADATGGVATGYQYACAAQAVTVAAQRTTGGVDAALLPGGAVSGTITLSGAATSGVDTRFDGVEVLDLATGREYDGYVSSDHTYRVGGLPAGNYAVCVDNASVYDETSGAETEYGAECYRDRPYEEFSGEVPDGATSVAVTVGAATTGIDATLTAS